MKEKTREHHLEQTFALVSPSDHLRLRGNSTSSLGLPTVVIESSGKQEFRKQQKGCIRRYLNPLLYITLIVVVVDCIYDYFFVGMGVSAPPIIQRDYATIRSIDDVTTDHLQSKCFHKQPTCQCEDPTTAKSRQELPQWARIHHINKEAAMEHQGDDVDVIFLGDSITEGWLGTSYGQTKQVVHDVPAVFKSFFSIQDEGSYEGIALGIAGDTVRTVIASCVVHLAVQGVSAGSPHYWFVRSVIDSLLICCGEYKTANSPIV